MQVHTEQVKTLQKAQWAAREALYDAFNKVWTQNMTSEEFVNHPDYAPHLAAYNKTVDDLIAVLGVDASCCDVDMDLWGSYSDWHKSEHGFRPRGYVTVAEVKKEMAATAVTV